MPTKDPGRHYNIHNAYISKRERSAMADSQDKNKPISPANFADDLDSMLDDAASAIDSDELMDDDDAIDKLLMENAFDEQELSDEEDDFGRLFTDETVSEDQEIDEFDDDLQVGDEIVQPETKSPRSTDPVGFSDDSAMAEIDEFADFDEFADIEPELPEPPRKEAVETVPEPEFDNDDFTLAEFDISDAEDTVDEFATTTEQDDALEEVSIEFEATDDPENTKDDLAEPGFLVYDDAAAQPEQTVKPVVDDVMSTQISQLFSEQETLKDQLAALSGSIGQGHAEEIDRLTKLHNQLKKQLDNHAKTPIIAYLALAVGILALLTAGTFVYLGMSTDSDIESLSESVSTLEENQTELNALLIKKDVQKIAEINPATDPSGPLADPQVVADQSNEQTAITSTKDESNSALAQMGEKGTSVEQLEAVEGDSESKSLDAVKASEPTEEAKSLSTEKNEQVAALEAKIRELEAKLAAATASPAPKTVKKPVAPVKRSPARTTPTARWAVNLISFKQDWYANRKAAEFAKQGISAKVIPVQVKGETWYRLSVFGFKSRDEASAYAARVKRTHNLDSVWIGKD